MKETRDYRKPSKPQLTDCYCPKCEKIYKRRIDYTGRGIPKLYCDLCLLQNNAICLPSTYSIEV